MKKILSIILAVCLVVTIGFIASGCKATTAETTAAETTAAETTAAETTAAEETAPENPVITFWANSDFFPEATQQYLADFEAASGYKFDIVMMPGGQQQYDFINSNFLAGNYPDIIGVCGIVCTQITKHKEVLVPLSETNPEIFENLYPDVFEAITGHRGGVAYHVPEGGMGMGYLYRKDIFEAAGVTIPETYKEFWEVTCPKLKEAGYTPLYGMGKDVWSLGIGIEMAAADQCFDEDIIKKLNSREIEFKDTDLLVYLEEELAAYKNGFYNEDVLVGSFEGQTQAILDGTVAMTAQYSTLWSVWKDAIDNLGMFTVSRKTDRRPVWPASGWGVPLKGKNTEGAIEFLKWCVEIENLEKYYTASGYTSIWNGVNGNPNPIDVSLFENYSGIPPGITFGILAADTGLRGQIVADVLSEVLTPLGALEKVQETFEKNAKDAGVPGFE